MAVPEQIKEVTVTKATIPLDDIDSIALAADPDRILLGIHARPDAPVWYHAISSTAPVNTDTMIEHEAGASSIFFTTHVPTETVYIHYPLGSVTTEFFIEHASRSSTT